MSPGRRSKDTPMDFSNLKLLIAATAASPHAKLGFYGFEFTNECVAGVARGRYWV